MALQDHPCESKIIRMKELSPLEEIRHSTAHVLATAVVRLYPDTKLDIGPPTDKGFYYDFDSEVSFTPEILEKIEVEMAKVIKENQKFERMEVSRQEAKEIIRKMNQEEYKLGRLDDIPEGETISFYRNGEFMDLCAGSHVSYTKKSKHLNCCKLRVLIIVEMLPINNCKEFMVLRLPPKMNLQAILNKSKKLKKETIEP